MVRVFATVLAGVPSHLSLNMYVFEETIILPDLVKATEQNYDYVS